MRLIIGLVATHEPPNGLGEYQVYFEEALRSLFDSWNDSAKEDRAEQLQDLARLLHRDSISEVYPAYVAAVELLYSLMGYSWSSEDMNTAI